VQVNHADIGAQVTAVNRAFEGQTITQFLSPVTAAGRAALDQLVTRQATIIAYIDDYKLLLVATLAVVPLIFLFTKTTSAPDHTVALE
jgi:DHA2 family multidrug resistance protein